MLGIKFEKASQNIFEGDEVTITIVSDHTAEVDITFELRVTPLTASGETTHVAYSMRNFYVY